MTMVTFLPVCECCTVVSLWMMGKLYFLMICKLNRSCYGAQSKYQMDLLQSEVVSHELMTLGADEGSRRVMAASPCDECDALILSLSHS